MGADSSVHLKPHSNRHHAIGCSGSHHVIIDNWPTQRNIFWSLALIKSRTKDSQSEMYISSLRYWRLLTFSLEPDAWALSIQCVNAKTLIASAKYAFNWKLSEFSPMKDDARHLCSSCRHSVNCFYMPKAFWLSHQNLVGIDLNFWVGEWNLVIFRLMPWCVWCAQAINKIYFEI